jgi:hypothetical protein
MRDTLLLLLVAALASLPAAADTGTSNALIKSGEPVEGPVFEGDQTEGDTIEEPFIIPDLPIYDTGYTCGFTNDYDEVCPYAGSTAPDVVYRYEPYYDQYVDIDLCYSLYDTKVYVYDFEHGFGFDNPYGCNDDACGTTGYQSRLETTLYAGHTYYIVVDGYSTDCGHYEISIDIPIYEILECPPNALLEGEEDCHDDYDDQYNGGCNTLPDPVFQPLGGSLGGIPFDVCGTSGTYLMGTTQYRDTDWFELTVTEESTITFECTAEFPLRIFMLDGNAGCEEITIIDSDTADNFPDMASLTHTFAPGTYWFWVGPSVFEGIPCGSLYVMTITGYGSGTSPARSTTWGEIKGLYR